MSIIKAGADLIYTFRFLKLLTTKWKNTDAFKRNIIDSKGVRIKKNLDSDDRKVYNKFHRLVFAIKRIVEKVPGVRGLGSYAAALYLVKEELGVDPNKIIEQYYAVPLSEQHVWYLLEDNQLAPGVYHVEEHKLINDTCEELVRPMDKIRIEDDCFPVGDLNGIQIYEAIHIKTQKTVYVTAGELRK